MIFWTAILLGLGGSLHCVSMCGPIALALPLTKREKGIVLWQSLLYHLGRTSTYALLGLFFGSFGWGIALAGYQNSLSIALGILLLLTGLLSISVENKLLKYAFFQSFLDRIKSKLSRALSIRSNASAYRIGLLNGFLPCGLVYMALAGSIATSGPIAGAMYMTAFGLGTVPLLLGVMVLGKMSGQWYRRFYQVIPYGLSLFGIYLIYRGMILEIPVSLSFWESGNFPVMCH